MSTTPTDPVLEMKINGVWTDITADCRLESADSGGGFDITRGRPNEGAQTDPTGLDFVLNNGASKVASTLGQSSVYSPRNPLGPYFGYLGRNQQIRLGLNRRVDDFTRAALVGGWGSLPSKTTVTSTVLPPVRWNLTGAGGLFGLNGAGQATIAPAAGSSVFATMGTYGDCEVKAKFKVSTRDTEFGLVTRMRPTVLPFGLTDGTFETGLSTWQATGGTLALDASIFHSGTQSARSTVVGAPASPSINITPTSPSTMVAVTPPNSYRVRLWGRVSIATTMRAQIAWYTSSLSLIGANSNDIAVAANTWTISDVTYGAPQDAAYARVTMQVLGSPAAGTNFWLDDVEVQDVSNQAWYSTYITPGTTDEIRMARVGPGGTTFNQSTLATNIIADTYYWMKTQVTGQRIRAKFWKDGDAEPAGWNNRLFDNQIVQKAPGVGTTGEVGFILKGGTGTLTVDSFEVNVWRAHTEIAELPIRWDLSRSDRWVPVKSRGILRRLGQGRKDLESAVTLHFESYIGQSYGWWPSESDTGESSGNRVSGGIRGNIQGLEYGSPDLTGPYALPGVAGLATLNTDTSFMVLPLLPHSFTGTETVAWFFRIPPNVPAADVQIAQFASGGTARIWQVWIQTDLQVRVQMYDKNFVQLGAKIVACYFGDQPVGTWLACSLTVNQSGPTVNYAWNYTKPDGKGVFYTANQAFVGQLGTFNSITFRGAPALTANGGLQVSQIFHYNGDLPFVTYDFANAASAYIGEKSLSRVIRLGTNAGAKVTTMGAASGTNIMGAQLPGQLLDLMTDAADADDGILMESRDDFELCIRSRASMFNQQPRVLDIDAGQLSAPLEPSDDDQGTRNDVTVSRPNGGFARSVQLTGPLNTQQPEVDPINGVGIYEEGPSINVGSDDLLVSHANWRRSKGTVNQPRYPNMHADLTATAYQNSPALAAELLAMDAGDWVNLDNPEIVADPTPQIVQSYVEKIDVFDHDVTFVTTPGDTYTNVGIVNMTARVGSESNQTSGAFVSGTDTKMTSVLTNPDGSLWVQIADSIPSLPFDIDVSGVRLRVLSTGNVLNSNPHFETDVSGWVGTSGNITIARDVGVVYSGTASLRMTAAAAGTDGAVQAPASSCITVAGTQYQVSGWIGGSDIAMTDLSLVVDWYQADNTTFISTSATTPIAPSSGGVWFQALVTAPALGVRARIRVKNTFASAGRLWADDLRLMPVASYSASPQTLTVQQTPINGIIKTIPSGSVIRLAAPWRVGW